MSRWYAMSTRFLCDPKIEALGERHGPAGPLVIVALLAQAKLQNKAGGATSTYRTLAHESFADRADVARIVSDAAETGLLDIEQGDEVEVSVRFPAWTRWQDARRKANEREARKRTDRANVRSSPEVSGDVPTDRQTETDKDRQTNREVGGADAPLSHLLADLIESNGARRPRIGKRWVDAERLMLERDGRSYAEAERLIRWAQASDFWRANILSMPKFREKYDQLLLQAKAEKQKSASPGMANAHRLAERARQREAAA